MYIGMAKWSLETPVKLFMASAEIRRFTQAISTVHGGMAVAWKEQPDSSIGAIRERSNALLDDDIRRCTREQWTEKPKRARNSELLGGWVLPPTQSRRSPSMWVSQWVLFWATPARESAVINAFVFISTPAVGVTNRDADDGHVLAVISTDPSLLLWSWSALAISFTRTAYRDFVWCMVNLGVHWENANSNATATATGKLLAIQNSQLSIQRWSGLTGGLTI